MKLLFICTHNRCRSILCESIANHLEGSEDVIRTAFYSVMDTIEFRIRKLLAMNPEDLSSSELRAALLAMTGED